MSIKILTQNSIEVTNIDGARENNFTAGNRSGIIKGAFNEGNFFSASSNVIALDSCELLVSGHRVVIDSAEAITLNNTPSVATRYSMIAEIAVDASSTPTFRLFIQNANIELRQDNLFKTTSGTGTYQIEIGNFTLNTSGVITDISKTIDVIVGGKGDSESGTINVGNVTTNTLDAGMDAEFDVTQRYDEETKKTYTDFMVGIPSGSSNILNIGSVETLPFGESATASITGTSPNQILNLGIPQGRTGEKGDLGLYQLNYTLSTEIGVATEVPEGAFPASFDFQDAGQLLLSTNGIIGEYHGYTFGISGGLVYTKINLNGEKGEKGDAGVTFEYDSSTKTLTINTGE